MKRGITISIPAAILLIIAAVIYIIFIHGGKSGNDQTVVTKSTLMEVLEISELSTITYTYNGIVQDSEILGITENGNEYGEITRYISYEGTVKAGIDFSKIDIQIEEETKEIKVKLPETEIFDTIVDEGSLEYIHKKSQSDSRGGNYQKAFQVCSEDLKRKAQEDETLLKLAKENGQSVVKALLQPWTEQMEEGYHIVVE